MENMNFGKLEVWKYGEKELCVWKMKSIENEEYGK